MPRPSSLVLSPYHHMGEPDIIVPNTVPNAGEEDFLQAIFQNVFPIAGGANFHVGLCNQAPAETDTHASITTEPTVGTNGYARQTIPRNATGWPTIATVNGHKSIRSTTETFTASGGNFDAAITRAYLCDAASGTSGALFSYSGALTAELTVLDGQSFQMQYECYLD